jgi:hypothetical protein
VCGSGKVARRGVGGRGARHEAGWMVRVTDAGRDRIMQE